MLLDDWTMNHAIARARSLRAELTELVVHATNDEAREAVHRVISWCDTITSLAVHP